MKIGSKDAQKYADQLYHIQYGGNHRSQVGQGRFFLNGQSEIPVTFYTHTFLGGSSLTDVLAT